MAVGQELNETEANGALQTAVDSGIINAEVAQSIRDINSLADELHAASANASSAPSTLTDDVIQSIMNMQEMKKFTPDQRKEMLQQMQAAQASPETRLKPQSDAENPAKISEQLEKQWGNLHNALIDDDKSKTRTVDDFLATLLKELSGALDIERSGGKWSVHTDNDPADVGKSYIPLLPLPKGVGNER